MNQRSLILQCVQTFSAKLVLEVFGGGGAIWGFSEAIGLRDSSTVWFWRPFALVVATIFFARWIKQLQEYLVEEMKIDKRGTYEEQVSMTAVNETHDLALGTTNALSYT
mmetsp:Transcript_5938/g.11221  ORF Transcript_5938/g.11221 Transcript_5938/m.11221 type:complete len:109 (+) Transcript_5938:113-439(+)